MLFISPSLAEKRRTLFRKMERGAVSPVQGFRRALEYDPFDMLALMVLGKECEGQGDAEAARRYFLRAAESEPANSEPYLFLMRSYESSGDSELSRGFSMLAFRKAVKGPERDESVPNDWIEPLRKVSGKELKNIDNETIIEMVSSLALTPDPEESERIQDLLLPHRLIQQVIERGAEGMARDAVDRIVENGAGCLPLLIGVVRGWARGGKLDDSPAAVAALALLGEIGDKGALPAIRECVDVDDVFVAETARWAVDRISGREADDPAVYHYCCAPLQLAESEDYEEEPHETVRKTQRPERNDLCWCGSGKKYKKCHLASDEQGGREDELSQDRRISDMLLQFMKENIRHDEMQQAITQFFGRSRPAELAESDQIALFDWLLNDYVPRRFRRTIAQEFLARSAARLTPQDRSALEDRTNSYSSLFEAQRIEKGVGVELKDLLMGGTLFAHDVTSSNSMARWDCFLARVRREGDRTVFTGVAMGLKQMDCEKLREWIIADKQASGLDWMLYLRASSHRIRQECVEMYEEKRNNMRLVTAEGDEVVFSKTSYRVRDRERLLAALEAEELIGDRNDEDGAIRFTWFQTPEMTDDGRRVLGSLRIKDDRLTLECSSRQRLKQGVALIQKLAGDAVDKKRNEYLSAQEAMQKMPKSAPERRISDDAEKQLVTELKERHFQSWPDRQLPVLGGRTPREAARDPNGRARLITLLKDFENSEERERMNGRAWYDVSRLKTELGVEF